MPAREDVERRAYELYEARGGEPGHDWDDWLQAERELAAGEPAAARASAAVQSGATRRRSDRNTPIVRARP